MKRCPFKKCYKVLETDEEFEEHIRKVHGSHLKRPGLEEFG